MSSAIPGFPDGFRAGFYVFFRPFTAQMHPETRLPAQNRASGVP